ncbi:GNAT family N-acetyltransferase [Paenibacillus glacialis]|uniref:GNAT family acetyltransferase n=1 Tax=Paenibacillus glacialis TaxID=494026 RepID=A0A169ZFV3_9BACL|nr:GNAT family N-acetyltransferase [Paenibacillus glacialis]OAB39766.1 GNAT family acetyltransferase [Paenibacillus glacialis]
MITYQIMTQDLVNKLKEIDRSEHIDLIYEIQNGQIEEITTNHECPNWDEELIEEIQERYLFELRNGGLSIGAFDGDTLVGFGVLAHQFRGPNHDQLQIDLMYVSNNYRRQGIGTQILNGLSEEARNRGAKYLYISSTETKSAVSFYKSHGSQITEDTDVELFNKEPLDIHMINEL